MRHAFVVFALVSISFAAEKKTEIFVADSHDEVTSYNVPARALCLPGSSGPACAAAGPQTGYAHFISIKARLGDTGILLTCAIRQKKDAKHCATLMPNHEYPAEAKGNDKLIVFGWMNPLFHGDMSKAQRFEYRIAPRELDPTENGKN